MASRSPDGEKARCCTPCLAMPLMTHMLDMLCASHIWMFDSISPVATMWPFEGGGGGGGGEGAGEGV